MSNAEMARLAAQLQSSTIRSGSASVAAAAFAGAGEGVTKGPEQTGMAAQGLAATIPGDLYAAAHDPDSVTMLVLGLVLEPVPALRDRQLALIGQKYGKVVAQGAREISLTIDGLVRELHLPLLELCFPAIRRLTWQQQQELHALVDELITIDEQVSVFEYLLSRLLLQIMRESGQPRRRVRTVRTGKLYRYRYELGLVFSVLAEFGHEDRHVARKAYVAGLYRLSPNQDWPDMHVPRDWPVAMDTALARLDLLRPLVKEELITALKTTAGHDGRDNAEERELMRVIAGLIHVPMPMEPVTEYPWGSPPESPRAGTRGEGRDVPGTSS